MAPQGLIELSRVENQRSRGLRLSEFGGGDERRTGGVGRRGYRGTFESTGGRSRAPGGVRLRVPGDIRGYQGTFEGNRGHSMTSGAPVDIWGRTKASRSFREAFDGQSECQIRTRSMRCHLTCTIDPAEQASHGKNEETVERIVEQRAERKRPTRDLSNEGAAR